MEHWSDCAVHLDEHQACSCGGLNLTLDMLETARVAFIPSTGRFGFFVDHMGGEGFVEAHSFPTDTLVRIAAASNLIDAHSGVPAGESSNCMDLDDARPTIIAKLKAFALSESVTRD